MVTERVANELRAALNTLRGERESLDKQISDLEALLARMGAPVKRGPGRPPKASAPVAAPAPVKRGPGRPPKAAAAPGARRRDAREAWSGASEGLEEQAEAWPRPSAQGRRGPGPGARRRGRRVASQAEVVRRRP